MASAPQSLEERVAAIVLARKMVHAAEHGGEDPLTQLEPGQLDPAMLGMARMLVEVSQCLVDANRRIAELELGS